MRTNIYLHHGKCLCAIVYAEDGYKFVDNIERFCSDWQSLIDEAKTGFERFPFYDRYKNYDVGFWDQYLDIVEGDDDNYEYLGCINDGIIDFDSERLKNKGEYFAPLLAAIKISEIYDFHSIHDIVFANDYIVLSSDYEVMACTNINIPYEPNPEQAAFRELIRNKLKALRPFENQILCAEYGSTVSQFSDVENALFYNIGTAFFNSALTKETTVCFQRMQPNELCGCENMDFHYFYHYFWAPNGNCKYWWEHELICEWNQIPLAKVNSTSKALDYYLAIKNHLGAVKCFVNGIETTLGLKIQLFIPKTSSFSSIVSAMKPMIDGVICAFHTPDEIAVDEISKLLNINREVLTSAEKTCLGKCCYISPYQKSVKWNPRDDRLDCVVIDPVTVEDEGFSFSGQLFAIPCYM